MLSVFILILFALFVFIDTEWRQTKQKKIRMNTDNIGYMTQNEDKQSKQNKNEHGQH
jgi:hypothetical protein